MRILITTLLSTIIFAAYCQDYALKQLNQSPRHHEWVKVKYGDRIVHCFVAFPEKSKKTTGIMVLHENRGLTEWVRSFTDQLAKEGYVAIAPDLLSGFSEDIDKTSDFATSDEARSGIYQLDANQVTKDLNAVQDYLEAIPSCNGKTAVMGFCWGGSNSFRFATNNQEIEAAFVFYGSAPDIDAMKNIVAPVYGFYGENDARINSGIPETDKNMKTLGNSYQYEIYKGAGHAYMRRGDDPKADKASKQARDDSWKRILKLLKEI